MSKKRGLLITLMLMLVILLAVPVSAKAASFKITKKSGVTTPTSIKKGKTFAIKGTVKANQKMKKVVVTVYNSTGKTCLQRYTAYPNSKTYNLANADPYISFEKLAVGKYYYRICAYNSAGTKKRVVNKKFTITGTGSIKIVNPVPSANVSLSAGSSYSIGGTIKSTYNLGSVTAKIINSSNKAVYTKTVKPNKKSYTVTNSALDAAMYFNNLTAGSYTFRLSATDVQGQNVVLIQRTIKVTGSSTSTNSTGGSNPYSGNTSYLTYNNASTTTTASFTARTTRPAASSKYYYNESLNVYYKYDWLAPTGKAVSKKSYVLGNCTWYACGRAMEIVAQAGGSISKVQAIFGGDPVGIYNSNVKLKKFSYGSTPKVGALAIFNYGSSGDAHIAVVEAIVNGVPYVSESGYTVSSVIPKSDKSNIIFKYQSIYNWAGGRSLLGYIYLI